jgi:hypothetical protein
MPRFNSAIDTAARFGDIPFVEFTQELITGVFDSLVEAHILQVEEYAEFVQTLTQDLSTYINNTNDGVSFDEISDFVLKYDLPAVSEAELESVLDALESPSSSSPVSSTPATTDTWWGGLMNALAPAVDSLVDKIPDPSQHADLEALSAFNNGVTSTMPNYQQIYSAIASLISSNKYSVLQNMAQQGMMRLVVTEGEIETKITFSTWQEQENTYETKNKTKVRQKSKLKLRKGALGAYKKAKRNEKRRQVTVNTAKSYHRDTSGTKVDIFGRVLIRFKTDYAPLNG